MMLTLISAMELCERVIMWKLFLAADSAIRLQRDKLTFLWLPAGWENPDARSSEMSLSSRWQCVGEVVAYTSQIKTISRYCKCGSHPASLVVKAEYSVRRVLVSWCCTTWTLYKPDTETAKKSWEFLQMSPSGTLQLTLQTTPAGGAVNLGSPRWAIRSAKARLRGGEECSSISAVALETSADSASKGRAFTSNQSPLPSD